MTEITDEKFYALCGMLHIAKDYVKSIDKLQEAMVDIIAKSGSTMSIEKIWDHVGDAIFRKDSDINQLLEYLIITRKRDTK